MSDIPPFHQRLIDEQQELQVRLGKLRDYMGGENYQALDGRDQVLLARQSAAMTVYNEILCARLLRLESPQDPVGEPDPNPV